MTLSANTMNELHKLLKTIIDQSNDNSEMMNTILGYSCVHQTKKVQSMIEADNKSNTLFKMKFKQRLKSVFSKRKPRTVAVRNAFQHDRKKLKQFEYDLLLMWKGKPLTNVKMSVQAPDRVTAKHEIMSVLQFKLTNLHEITEKTKKAKK